MLLVLLGIGILFWVLTQVWRYRSLRKWHVVDGRITQYSVESFKQSQVYILAEKIHPILQYTYEVYGVGYKGSKITLEDHALICDPESATQPWPIYELDETLPIYVDPANPGNTVLIKNMLPYRVNHYSALAITGILFIIIGSYINNALP